MNTIDRLRGALHVRLLHFPLRITTHNRMCSREYNAFQIGVDYGASKATTDDHGEDFVGLRG